MKFGVCTEQNNLEVIEQAGSDYIECTVVGLNNLNDEQLDSFAERLKRSRIKCEVLSILFPGSLPLVGSDMDIKKIKKYLINTFKKVSIVNPEIIVFGSGRSRMCPNGFNYEHAYEQLIEVCNILAEAAALFNVTIAFEALNKSETNMINTLQEASGIIKTINHPNFKLLADIYHMQMENEPAFEILKYKDLLVHTHIAAKTARECPKPEDKNIFMDYFKSLKDIGYNKRMSIEGRIENFSIELPAAFDLFRSY